MGTRAKQRVFALVGLIALILAVVWVVQKPASGRLLDGTEVVLHRASYGTNDAVPEASLTWLFRHVPPAWLNRMKWNPSSGRNGTTDRSNFTFWLKFSSATATTQSISYAIADEDGFESMMVFDGPYGSSMPGGFSSNYVGLVRSTCIFPRHSRKFSLRLYQPTETGERLRVAEFEIRNAGLQRSPQWKPQELPIQQQTNGLVLSLVKAEVGVSPPGALVPPYVLQGGEWSESEKLSASHIYYVFILLEAVDESPVFHVVPSKIVQREVSSSHRRWLAGRKRDGSARKDTSMRQFWDLDGEYRDRWNLLLRPRNG